jgi:hypothetical protein
MRLAHGSVGACAQAAGYPEAFFLQMGAFRSELLHHSNPSYSAATILGETCRSVNPVRKHRAF